MSECSTNRFFGPVQTHIKMYQGSFVAVEGPNMTHKMNTLPSMQFPFQQVLSARITLRAGQVNYLLNHLGLGDNATFLAITALYDDKSKFEADNYVQYSYFSDKNRIFNFAQMLVLTGNSENRIEQLYLHNPNQHSAVVLEVMVAIIDEYYDFFEQNGDSDQPDPIVFHNINQTDIDLYDETPTVLVLNNKSNPPKPIAYLNLYDVNNITQNGVSLIIDDISMGTIIFMFKTESEAVQSLHKITNWIDAIEGGYNPYLPMIYFTSDIMSDTGSGNNTSNSGTGSFYGGTVSLGTASNITKDDLSGLIIDFVKDYNYNEITIVPNDNLIIKSYNGVTMSGITSSGTYSIYFNISDTNIPPNNISNSVNVEIIAIN